MVNVDICNLCDIIYQGGFLTFITIGEVIQMSQARIKFLEALVKKLKKQLAKAKERSCTESLTGLPNHRGMEAEAKRALAQADRSKNPLSVLFIDLDFFKKINDAYGHGVGDAVLRGFATFLRKTVRKSDVVTHPGGDEFVVILPATDLAGAHRVADEISHALHSRRFTRKSLRLSVSVGAASTLEGLSTFRDLKHQADERMYASKKKRQ